MFLLYYNSNYSFKAIKGIPTCYIFSCPQDTRSPRPPFHTLVPQGPSREPGLILVSAAGQIRFWDSIGIGLAGGDNYVASQLEDIEYDEEITNLIRADVSFKDSHTCDTILITPRPKPTFFQHLMGVYTVSSSPLQEENIIYLFEHLRGPLRHTHSRDLLHSFFHPLR